MNKLIFKNTIRFFLLVFLQIVVFNQINLFGYINPFIYIIFIFLFPIRKNISWLLILGFALGLFIDIFSDSGGINTAATVFIAFIRLPILKAIMRKSDFDYLLFNILSLSTGKFFAYISVLTLIHHFIIFSLEYFNVNAIVDILVNTIFTSILTVVVSLFGILLFSKNK